MQACDSLAGEEEEEGRICTGTRERLAALQLQESERILTD
jgi:hypothetical protein